MLDQCGLQRWYEGRTLPLSGAPSYETDLRFARANEMLATRCKLGLRLMVEMALLSTGLSSSRVVGFYPQASRILYEAVVLHREIRDVAYTTDSQ